MTGRTRVDRGLGRLLSGFAGLFLAVTLGLAACQPIFTNHGYMPNEDDLALLQVGVDTRDSVATTIGRPAAEGLLNDEAWYYVQSRFRTIGPGEPVEIAREVRGRQLQPRRSGGTTSNVSVWIRAASFPCRAA